MRLKLAVVIAAALSVSAIGLAQGQDDPITARQEIMKMNGRAAKTAFDMASGKTPFDQAAAVDAMKTLQDDMAKFVTLFPEGSDQGDTEASPEIWKNFDDFKAHAEKLAADAKTAEAAAANGAEAFGASLQAIGGDCQSCHEKYRIKKG
jgi:cytochrome c556